MRWWMVLGILLMMCSAIGAVAVNILNPSDFDAVLFIGIPLAGLMIWILFSNDEGKI